MWVDFLFSFALHSYHIAHSELCETKRNPRAVLWTRNADIKIILQKLQT